MTYISKKERFTIVMSIIPILLWINVIYSLIMKFEMGLTVPVTIFITLVAFIFWITIV